MNNVNKLACKALFAAGTIAASQQAFAVAELTHPRDYIPAPPGTNVAVFYLDERSGDSLYSDGNKIANNMDLSVKVGTARFIHYTEINGYTIDPQIVIPHAKLDVGAAGQDSTGVGDVVIGAPIWLINDSENKQWFSIAPFLHIPVGAYNENKTVNWGKNTVRPVLEFGYVKGLTDNLYLDFVGGVEWSSDNDDPFGGNTLEKDPIYRLNSMLSYSLDETSHVWGKYVIQKGGEETLDGVSLDNEMDTSTLAFGFTKWVGKSVQLQGEYSKDLSVENGIKTDGFSLRLVTLF